MNYLVMTVILVVLVLMFIFLILREVNAWYWKINQRIQLLERQTISLQKIEVQLNKLTGHIPEGISAEEDKLVIQDQVTDFNDFCPACNNSISTSDQFCPSCGLRLV